MVDTCLGQTLMQPWSMEEAAVQELEHNTSTEVIKDVAGTRNEVITLSLIPKLMDEVCLASHGSCKL